MNQKLSALIGDAPGTLRLLAESLEAVYPNQWEANVLYLRSLADILEGLGQEVEA